MLIITATLITSFLSVTIKFSTGEPTDRTNVPLAFDRDVVEAVIWRLRSSYLFPEDYNLMFRAAFFENQNSVVKPNTGGIWKSTQSTFEIVRRNITEELVTVIDTKFNIQILSLTYNNLNVPMYSGSFAAVWIKMKSETEKLPQNLEGQAKYWLLLQSSDPVDPTDFINTIKIIDNEYHDDCANHLDLVFLLEGNQGEHSSLEDAQIEFVRSFAAKIEFDDPSAQHFRIGVVGVGTEVDTIVNLEDNLNFTAIHEKLNDIEALPSGQPSVNSGLKVIHEMFRNVPKRGVPKMAVIFSTQKSADGVGNIGAFTTAGIRSYVITIGEPTNAEMGKQFLQLSQGSSNQIFHLDGTTLLKEDFEQRLLPDLCRSHQILNFEEPYQALLDRWQKQYFAIQIPRDMKEIIFTAEAPHDKYSLNVTYSFRENFPDSAINDGYLFQKGYVHKTTIIPKEKATDEFLYLTVSLAADASWFYEFPLDIQVDKGRSIGGSSIIIRASRILLVVAGFVAKNILL